MIPCIDNSVTLESELGTLAFRFQHVGVLGWGHDSVLNCCVILISITSQEPGVTGTHRML